MFLLALLFLFLVYYNSYYSNSSNNNNSNNNVDNDDDDNNNNDFRNQRKQPECPSPTSWLRGLAHVNVQCVDLEILLSHPNLITASAGIDDRLCSRLLMLISVT